MGLLGKRFMPVASQDLSLLQTPDAVLFVPSSATSSSASAYAAEDVSPARLRLKTHLTGRPRHSEQLILR